MRMLLALVLLAAACKTDEKPKPAPAPAPAPAKLEMAPGPKPAPPPADAPSADPAKSQQALEKRAAAFTKVAVAAKKNQSDCAKLAGQVPALAEELRAITAARADLARDDRDIDLVNTNLALKTWVEISFECKDAAKFDPVLDALTEESKR